jgi:hypothetical protein
VAKLVDPRNRRRGVGRVGRRIRLDAVQAQALDLELEVGRADEVAGALKLKVPALSPDGGAGLAHIRLAARKRGVAAILLSWGLDSTSKSVACGGD